VQPRHLKPLLQFAKRWPDLPIVINHGAKPRVAAGELDPWRDDLAALASLPNIFCKLSGLRTEQAEGQAADLLAPYVSHILKCFTTRTMWGSDWPVLLHTQDTYSDWVFTARRLAGDIDHTAEQQLFAGAAAQFYGIALDCTSVHLKTLASGMPDTAKTESRRVALDELGKLAFGCAPIGNLYGKMPDEVAAATIRAALDADIRYFDTAPQYGFGLSEKRLGAVLAEQDSSKTVTVSTKVGRRLDPAIGTDLCKLRQCFLSPEPFESVFDYSYDGVMRTFEQSQRRLRRERIDILYAHDLGRFAHGDNHPRLFAEFLEGGFRAMYELRKSGVVGAIGIAVNECEICTEMLAEVELDIIELAGRYTLLDQQALETLLPLCERRHVRLVIGAPYNSGILASGVKNKPIGHYNYGPASPDVVARVSAIEAICGAHSVRLAAAALQFPLWHPQVVSVIAGANSPQRVLEAVEAMKTEIPSALWSDLKNAGLIRPNAPVPQA
jgi:D-threo-aldose 1-dehydrogenase